MLFTKSDALSFDIKLTKSKTGCTTFLSNISLHPVEIPTYMDRSSRHSKLIFPKLYSPS